MFPLDLSETKFAERIHSEIEKKSHRHAEEKEADLEIQASLSESRKMIHLVCRAVYTLKVELIQEKPVQSVILEFCCRHYLVAAEIFFQRNF